MNVCLCLFARPSERICVSDLFGFNMGLLDDFSSCHWEHLSLQKGVINVFYLSFGWLILLREKVSHVAARCWS